MEKTKLELFTICDYASISQEGKLSIMGIFDQMVVNSIPTNYSQFYIVGTLIGSPNKKESVTLTIKNPEGTDALPSQKLDLVFGPNGKSNIIMNVGNFPVNVSGFYKIVLSAGTKKLGEKEFGVFLNKQNLNISPQKYKYRN